MRTMLIMSVFCCANLLSAESPLESGFRDAFGAAKTKVVDQALPETVGAKSYREGIALRYGQPLDSERAARLFRRGYEAGNADCAYELAICYLHGYGVARSQSKALEILLNGVRLKEGSAADCEAQWLVLHAGDVISLYDKQKAPEFARRLVELSTHSTRAAAAVTRLLYVTEGDNPHEMVSPSEHQRAVSILKIKAAAGDALASLEYGKILIGSSINDPAHPKYVKPDIEEGLRLIDLAAEKGVPGACFLLYQYYSNKDVKPLTAFKWLSKAWDLGDCEAGLRLSNALLRGQGTAVDKNKAMEVALRVGEQGNADQVFAVADFFTGYTGFEPSAANFLTWHRIAAERGSADSAHLVAMVYSGEETKPFKTTHPVSVDDAFKYFKMAAYPDGEANYVYRLKSLLYLGDMYRRGIGCERDPDMAAKVYYDYLKLFRSMDFNGTDQYTNGGKVRLIWLIKHYPDMAGLPGLGDSRLRFDGFADDVESFEPFGLWQFDLELFGELAKVISTRDSVEQDHFLAACGHVNRAYRVKDAAFYYCDLKYGKVLSSDSYGWYKYVALSGSPAAAYRLSSMLMAKSGPGTMNAGPEYALRLSMGRTTRETVVAFGEHEAWRRFGDYLVEIGNDTVGSQKIDYNAIGAKSDISFQYSDRQEAQNVLPILQMIKEAHRAQILKNAQDR